MRRVEQKANEPRLHFRRYLDASWVLVRAFCKEGEINCAWQTYRHAKFHPYDVVRLYTGRREACLGSFFFVERIIPMVGTMWWGRNKWIHRSNGMGRGGGAKVEMGRCEWQ